MTSIMKIKLEQVEQLRAERERIKIDDIKTLKLYQSLNDEYLFSKTYEKVLAEAVHRGEYDFKFQVEEEYGSHYKLINTSDSVESKINKFRTANPLKIRL